MAVAGDSEKNPVFNGSSLNAVYLQKPRLELMLFISNCVESRHFMQLKEPNTKPDNVMHIKHLLIKAEQVLITASCKMAVKAGDPLSQEEMNQLIADLLQCKNPFVCPHGRPIIVSLSNWELDRKFRRA